MNLLLTVDSSMHHTNNNILNRLFLTKYNNRHKQWVIIHFALGGGAAAYCPVKSDKRYKGDKGILGDKGISGDGGISVNGGISDDGGILVQYTSLLL